MRKEALGTREPALASSSPYPAPEALPAPSLARAVIAYRRSEGCLKAGTCAALDRLTTSEPAARAFATLAVDDEAKGRDLVAAWVYAYRLVSGLHAAQVERLRAESNRLGRIQTVLDELAELLASPSRVRGETDGSGALDALRNELSFRKFMHEFDVRTTSRNGDARAARSRAFGALKESVRRLSGKANLAQVAALAAVLFDSPTPIAPRAVKDATTPEEWWDRHLRR